MKFDLVIKNVKIADGFSSELYDASVGISKNKITAITKYISADLAEKVIDGKGKLLTPGFIDCHGHSDMSILAAPEATGKISQGITSEIAGNCGLSVFPITNKNHDHLQRLFAHYNINISWKNIQEYAAQIAKIKPAINLASLCGHNTLRAAVLGYENKDPDPNDLLKMQEYLRDSQMNGAMGLSFGLLYVPGKFAKIAELTALGKVVAESAKIATTHLRSEGNFLLEAIDEFANFAENSGCKRLQISHLKTAGPNNWSKIDKVFQRISQIQASGVNLTADRYPFIEAMTQLSAYMPEPYSDMDDVALENFLNEPSVLGEEDNFARFIKDVDDDFSESDWKRRKLISTSANFAKNKNLNGLNFLEISEALQLSPARVCAQLLKEDSSGTMAASEGMSEENMLRIYQKKYVMCCTDESARPIDYSIGRSHPRGFSSFPKFLKIMSSVLGIPETIKRMTSLPAETFGLLGRGKIQTGYFADLVLLDMKKINKDQKTANFATPHIIGEGVDKVWVNGRLSYDSQKEISERNGVFISN